MKTLLTDLRRNLASGVRLATFRRVAPLDFRISAGQLVALCAVSILIGIGIDRLGFEGDVLFDVTALEQEVLYLAALLFMSLVLSSGFRQPGLALALPVLVTAAAPLLHLGALAYVLWPEGSARMNRIVALTLWIFSWLWLLLVVWRALAVLLLPRRSRTRSLIAALSLVAFSWAIHDAFPFGHWWYEPDVATASSRWPSPASEAVLAAQPGILDEALSDIDDERPGALRQRNGVLHHPASVP